MIAKEFVTEVGLGLAVETFTPPWDAVEDEQEFGVVMNSLFEDFYKL